MILTVQTPAEKLAALDWPELETVRHVSLTHDDCLVVCVGFEDRALAVLRNASMAQRPFQLLLVHYKPFVPENREEDVRRICHEAAIQPQEMEYDREDPAGFGRELAETLAACRGRIFLDISGMSRLLITQALVALGARPQGFSDCFVFYAQAEVYPPSEEEARKALEDLESDPTFSLLFLSSGVFAVTVDPDLSALAMAGAQTRLIAFPSLDEHHLIALQAELQPSRATWIEGVPPEPRNFWRRDFIAKMNHLDEQPKNYREQMATDTLDYRDTLRCLLDIYERHAIRERLLLAPTGSKMQTVAVGIFRAFVHDVQIVYPTPRGFRKPKDYTHGEGSLHCLALTPFRIEAP